MGQGQVKLEEHVVTTAGRVCDHRYRDGESVCGKRHRKERHIPALAGLHPRRPRKRYEADRHCGTVRVEVRTDAFPLHASGTLRLHRAQRRCSRQGILLEGGSGYTQAWV